MELTNGAKIEYNWRAVSQKEWVALLADEKNTELYEAFASKLTSISIDELSELNPIDYARIKKGVVKSYFSETKTDSSKNLEGESTLP